MHQDLQNPRTISFVNNSQYTVCATYRMYVTKNIKPTSTTTPYPLGYKYNFEMVCSRVNLPTKAITKNGSGVLQKNV